MQVPRTRSRWFTVVVGATVVVGVLLGVAVVVGAAVVVGVPLGAAPAVFVPWGLPTMLPIMPSTTNATTT